MWVGSRGLRTGESFLCRSLLLRREGSSGDGDICRFSLSLKYLTTILRDTRISFFIITILLPHRPPTDLITSSCCSASSPLFRRHPLVRRRCFPSCRETPPFSS